MADQNMMDARRDKTGALDEGIFGPGCLGQRIQASALGAVACLPRVLRERAVRLWHSGNLQRLTEAMSHWIRGIELEEKRFAELFFGREADDPKVALLYKAALDVSHATTHGALGGGAEKIAAALQVIGLDRWPGFLADACDRALDPVTLAAIGQGADGLHQDIAHAAGEALPDQMVPDRVPVTGQAEHVPMPGQAGGGVRARASGLPPPDVVPPIRNLGKLSSGDASRSSVAENGGQSLWDGDGGEWRYNAADTWSGSYWDYNDHGGPASPWRSIPINTPAAGGS